MIGSLQVVIFFNFFPVDVFEHLCGSLGLFIYLLIHLLIHSF